MQPPTALQDFTSIRRSPLKDPFCLHPLSSSSVLPSALSVSRGAVSSGVASCSSSSIRTASRSYLSAASESSFGHDVPTTPSSPSTRHPALFGRAALHWLVRKRGLEDPTSFTMLWRDLADAVSEVVGRYEHFFTKLLEMKHSGQVRFPSSNREYKPGQLLVSYFQEKLNALVAVSPAVSPDLVEAWRQFTTPSITPPSTSSDHPGSNERSEMLRQKLRHQEAVVAELDATQKDLDSHRAQLEREFADVEEEQHRSNCESRHLLVSLRDRERLGVVDIEGINFSSQLVSKLKALQQQIELQNTTLSSLILSRRISQNTSTFEINSSSFAPDPSVRSVLRQALTRSNCLRSKNAFSEASLPLFPVAPPTLPSMAPSTSSPCRRSSGSRWRSSGVSDMMVEDGTERFLISPWQTTCEEDGLKERENESIGLSANTTVEEEDNERFWKHTVAVDLADSVAARRSFARLSKRPSRNEIPAKEMDGDLDEDNNDDIDASLVDALLAGQF